MFLEGRMQKNCFLSLVVATTYTHLGRQENVEVLVEGKDRMIGNPF